MRLMCCSGINIQPRNGATAVMHLVQLDRAAAQVASARPHVLWHSEMSPFGRPSVRLLPLREVPTATIPTAITSGGTETTTTTTPLLGEMEALYAAMHAAMHAARWGGAAASRK